MRISGVMGCVARAYRHKSGHIGTDGWKRFSEEEKRIKKGGQLKSCPPFVSGTKISLPSPPRGKP